MARDLSLTTFNKNIGKELVEQAIENRKKRLAELCVGEVESVVNMIEVTKRRIETGKEQLEICKRRLEAIEAGEITLNEYNGVVTIRYKDESLAKLPTWV